MSSQAPSPPRIGHRTFALADSPPWEDRTIERGPPVIAVIGGGFSGTLCALHLLRRCRSAHVVLIERNRQFGLGLAYSTGNPGHLLNVPAARMSAFHDRPLDFLDWLNHRATHDEPRATYDAESFVPRRVFGTYIRHLINAEFKTGEAERFELLHGEVCSIDDKNGLVLNFDRDRRVAVHMAIVAVGNFAPEPPRVVDPWLYETDFYRGDPWADDTLADLDPNAAVFLIGTGLTTVDTVMALLDRGHRGPIHALSRRGLLPRHHEPQSECAEFTSAALPSSVAGLVRFVRREIRAAEAKGIPWQAVIDALRPLTQGLWDTLPEAERARFLRHLRPWWDVHRHRMAPSIAQRIDEARRRKQLIIGKGRIAAFHRAASGVEVEYRVAGQCETETLRIDRIINCSGPSCDFDRVANPLIQNLLREGRARPDSLRLGLDVTPQGALRGADGAISQQLYAVGPITKGLFWEMTSVPDIRRQCELLATHLAQISASRRFAPLPEQG
jgi:uncharacterized NAD(P)/FAD-binding protein YdhS